MISTHEKLLLQNQDQVQKLKLYQSFYKRNQGIDASVVHQRMQESENLLKLERMKVKQMKIEFVQREQQISVKEVTQMRRKEEFNSGI